MDLKPALDIFFAESRELLQEMEESLLTLEHAGDDRDLLNAVFRAAHTIKGSAGVFGFDVLVEFTHEVETVLDRARAGDLRLDSSSIALLLQCGDHLAALVACVANEVEPDAALRAAGAELTASLIALGGTDKAHAPTAAPAHGAAATTAPTTAVDAPRYWRITLGFGAEVLRNGMDPLSFLRFLATLGEVVHVRTSSTRLPALDEFDPEACYLDLEVDFRSSASRAAIDEVFDFVRDDCRIDIGEQAPETAAQIAAVANADLDNDKLGDILVASAAVDHLDLGVGLLAQQGIQIGGARPLGEILVEQGSVSPVVVHAALERQQQSRQQKAQEQRLIRVDAEKLDQLITLIGELVIAGSGVHASAVRAADGQLVESAATLARLVEQVRDSALGLRMVQIGPTFQRFHRVVRDVSREIGKQIDLVIAGAETELDKSVVERIGDPLMHLVRNAMDHGIEAADARIAAGKPATARLALNACHDSGSIVIEVSDDGRGLDTEKIRNKAIERGLLAPGATPSEHEIHGLIFEPGFSTADAISNLSGRGVGMDVVKRNIEALRGSIEIDSAMGKGTTVRIRLPLTLAIIDGFLVGLGHARYVLPLDVVVECREMSAADQRAATEQGFVNVRGEALPVLRLRDVFAFDAVEQRRENLVVVRFGNLKAGLVVDELLGELQTVIKPLGKLFAFLPGISGSTILGSGAVALILDVAGLVKRATSVRPTAGQATPAAH